MQIRIFLKNEVIVYTKPLKQKTILCTLACYLCEFNVQTVYGYQIIVNYKAEAESKQAKNEQT